MHGSEGFRVLRSSAGAGKTHALAKRWLLLALSSGETPAYRRVLAITFTNKAARELKERVIQRLHALAVGDGGDGGLEDIRTALREAGLTDAVIQERAKAVFRHVLHHWADLAITTIDAFSRRVVKPFARDLMLDGDLEMTTDVEDYHRRAVDRLLMDAGSHPQLTGVLEQVAFNLIDDEEKWRPDLRLFELSSELEKGATREHLEKLQALTLEDLLRIESDARERTAAFRYKVRRMGQDALTAIREHDIDESELAHGNKGVISFLRRLSEFSGRMDPIGVNARTVFEGGKWHSAKADADAIRRIEAVRDLVEPVYHQYKELEPAFREHAIRSAIIRGLLPTAVLRELDQRLQELKRADGVNFFNDLTRKASGELQQEPPQFIFERIGERYRHMMIDEFQDTSLLQWAALLPLVENILGNGGSVQLVGDAKQAIYRWRDGEARLFSEFPQLFDRDRFHDGARLEASLGTTYRSLEPLKDNRRSGRQIVLFNNRLFERLAARLPGDGIRKIYDGLAQEPKAGFDGCVELSAFSNAGENMESDTDGTGNEVKENIRRTAEVVLRCMKDGYRAGDIAILVRGRSTAQVIAPHFADLGIAVFSNDGLLLDNDPDVACVIDLLRFLHAGEAEAAARAAQRMLPLLDAIAATDPVTALRQWSIAQPAIAAHHPIGTLMVDLMAALGISPVTDPYLMTLLDEAHAFTSSKGGDIGGFLEHWNSRGYQRSVRATGGGDAVNLLTIHKSKGLEFPVVIVPDTTMGSGKDGNEQVWIHADTVVPGIDAAVVPMGGLKDLHVPEIEETRRLQALDELNLLYVAFTRAAERLYAFVPEPKKLDADQRAKAPFRAELLDLIKEDGSGGVLRVGEPAAPQHKATERTPRIPLTGTGDLRSSVKVAVRREAPEDWDPADPDPYRSRGNLIHSIMASVASVDDLEGAIQRAVASGDLDRNEGGALDQRLRAVLASPLVAPFFRKGVEVRTEVTLIDRQGRSHRPDRIVRDDHGIHILDIKTGAPSASHHVQVRDYVRLVADVEQGSVSGHLFYLSSGHVENVVLP